MSHSYHADKTKPRAHAKNDVTANASAAFALTEARVVWVFREVSQLFDGLYVRKWRHVAGLASDCRQTPLIPTGKLDVFARPTLINAKRQLQPDAAFTCLGLIKV